MVKMYYALVAYNEEYEEELKYIDDYLVDTPFGVIAVDATSGEAERFYSSMEEYFESYPDCDIVELTQE